MKVQGDIILPTVWQCCREIATHDISVNETDAVLEVVLHRNTLPHLNTSV